MPSRSAFSGVLYSEDFSRSSDGGNQSVSTLGWHAYAGSSASDISVENSIVAISPAEGNPSGSCGALYASPVSPNQAFTIVKAFSNGVSIPADGSGLITWTMGNGDTGASVRLMIQIGGNGTPESGTWYASSTAFTSSSAVANFSAFSSAPTESVTQRQLFSPSALAWQSFTLSPGSSMTLGKVLASNLETNTITGIGFYMQGTAPAQNIRLDTLVVDSSSFAKKLGSSAASKPLAGNRSAVAAKPAKTLLESVNEAHSEIWKRFVSRDGTIFDYTDSAGKVILPTPEECKNNMPNALGWWSPIENGSFYGGIYMEGLCQRWSATKDPVVAEKARKLAGGLERLATTGTTPAFIARGFASDGKTVYPASSDDQSYPWFYGMWKYLSSGIPDATEKARLSALVEQVAQGFESIQWRIPSNNSEFGFFGGWDGNHCDANARLLFVIRATYEVTGNPKWLDLYRIKCQEKRGNEQLTRVDLISAGSHYVDPGVTPNYPMHPPIWTSASTQAGIRALYDLETDPQIREKYRAGLVQNARNAMVHLKLWRLFNPDVARTMKFDIDWRPLNDPQNGWAPQSTVKEAIKVGSNQWTPWKRIAPRRIYENDYVRDPLCAAGVIFLSGDQELMASARQEFDEAMLVYPWKEMFTVCFFWAENAYWRQAIER